MILKTYFFENLTLGIIQTSTTKRDRGESKSRLQLTTLNPVILCVYYLARIIKFNCKGEVIPFTD